MACVHKFVSYLNLQRLDFEPTTLIIGTFNPSWPDGNNAEWFYGRTHDEHGNQNNNFWDVLPRLYGDDSLIDAGPVEWKAFCSRKQIAITDLIYSIDDAIEENPAHDALLRGFADDAIADNFYDFELVNIVRLLRNRPTITNVYVTRSITATFWKHKLYAVKRYCQANGITLKSLLTPSGNAWRVHAGYNRQNLNAQLTLPNYILMRWQEVWHPLNL